MYTWSENRSRNSWILLWQGFCGAEQTVQLIRVQNISEHESQRGITPFDSVLPAARLLILIQMLHGLLCQRQSARVKTGKLDSCLAAGIRYHAYHAMQRETHKESWFFLSISPKCKLTSKVLYNREYVSREIKKGGFILLPLTCYYCPLGPFVRWGQPKRAELNKFVRTGLCTSVGLCQFQL